MPRPKFELTILGSNSAKPSYGRWPTSQVLSVANQLILIDAGEGCQIRLDQYKIKRNKIKYVLISHMHGDHLYGLPGFIGSLAHLSRTAPLIVYGPIGIKKYLETVFTLSESYISFELTIVELSNTSPEVIQEEAGYTITAFPVKHRIPTYGYQIKEKQAEKNIIRSKIKEYQLDYKEIVRAKNGEDLIKDGTTIPNEELTIAGPSSRSYAYCADTVKDGWHKEHLRGSSILYFETTYLHELVDLAHERGHTTAKEAGSIARELEVGTLVIGHYSSRYRDVEPLLEEAKKEFESTELGYDGFILNI